MDKYKVLHLESAFKVKELPTADEQIDSIYIEGYASTNDIDRAGDVVPASVWEAGIQNYLKNPIILAQHDHDDPIGRMVEHKIDPKGLWIKARISAAAEIFNLIKDGVVTAFSIGFRVLDAEYNSATELFVIKELELVEISVVSVPCNQNTIFTLSKSFANDADYKEFKKQFEPKENSAKGLEAASGSKGISKQKGFNMDETQIAAMLEKAAKEATEKAIKAVEEKAAKEAAEKAAKEAEEKAIQERIEKAVAARIEVGSSGAERLVQDLAKRLEEETAGIKDLKSALAEKTEEIKRIQESRMEFSDRKSADGITDKDKETAVLLGQLMGKSLRDTKFGAGLLEKAGPHVASATWELEVSTNMEAEVRRRLVVAPLLRSVAMKTNVMTLPVNPEAGYATWVQNAQFGSTASAGAAQTHQLKEITLNAYKVATLEYMNFEEEEDSLLVLMPLVRDAMVRRLALAVDKAYLLGAGSGADPVKGLSIYDATSVVTPTNTGAVTVANMRALRKDLGAWGLEPSELAYIVSTEVYYDLLDDTLFQTVDKVGDKATLLTGQVGSIGNSPVLVSSVFPTKAGGASTASTNIGAIAFAAGNFLAGNQRGLRFDTQDLVETQRKALVASLRTGLTQVTTNLGGGVSTLRWS